MLFLVRRLRAAPDLALTGRRGNWFYLAYQQQQQQQYLMCDVMIYTRQVLPSNEVI
jgi:hypothetical protein